jgi:hypothetical protein
LGGYDAWSSLAQPFIGDQFIEESVDAMTWDAFAEQYGLAGRVVMMKIDVEGWELYVLNGCSETLSRPDAPVLQVELNEKACLTAGTSSRAVIHLLESFGYCLYQYQPESWQLVPARLLQNDLDCNVIAVKDQAALMQRIQLSKVKGNAVWKAA